MHKGLSDDLMNLVNYMSSPFYGHNRYTYVFAGFVPLRNDYFGLYKDGVHYVAVHLSTEPVRKVVSDEDEREAKMIQSGKSWIAIFYGSDNTSFIKRFDSRKRMLKWFESVTELKRDDSWLYYNS